ncbi:hypothetical protein [Salinarimonas sp.]|uniref:hypothetical protein n=1 Tax=Salinarimonas sp. TaxID=2766526 RepID=UPI003919276F
MKNVTISLDDELAARARVEAAKQGKSLSRYVGELIEERIGRQMTQSEALEGFLAGPDWRSRGGPLPKREEIYEERLRRYERADLHARPRGADETGSGEGLG